MPKNKVENEKNKSEIKLDKQIKTSRKKEKMKSVDQMTIARLVANRIGLTIADVQEVIELEQKYTMDFIKRNTKVIKKNYLTLTPKIIKGKNFKSPLNGKEYELVPRKSVSIKLGAGFKSYISENGKKMPDKICRFVDASETLTI